MFSRISVTLIVLNILLALMYAILLLGTVMHAAGRQNAQTHMRQLSMQVEGLEAQYLTKTQSITPETALKLGFVVPTTVSTVYVDNGLHPLSLRTR